MEKIGLFWGSDTGVTEEIVAVMLDEIGRDKVDEYNMFNASVELFDHYQFLLLGLSTWYDGELQSDWDVFFETFQTLDFSGKTVALFGTGDQEGYAEYFVDGIGIIGEVVQKNGGQIVGHWPTEGYAFEASKGLVDDKHFLGLALDEDNQPALTDQRIADWLQIVLPAFQAAGWKGA